MKLSSPGLLGLIAWAAAVCGSGGGVRLMKKLSSNRMLKPPIVELKNIGARWFVRQVLWLKLREVLCISLSLLCSVVSVLVLSCLVSLGLLSPRTAELRWAKPWFGLQRRILLLSRRQMFPRCEFTLTG